RGFRPGPHLRAPPDDGGGRRGRLAARDRGFGRDGLGDDGFDLGVRGFSFEPAISWRHVVTRRCSAAASLRRARNSSSLMLPVFTPSTSAISWCEDPFS